MEKNCSKLPPNAGTFHFGRIAVARKYVTPGQVQDAIEEQAEDYITNSPRRLLGEILLENCLITEKQVESILWEQVKYIWSFPRFQGKQKWWKPEWIRNRFAKG